MDLITFDGLPKQIVWYYNQEVKKDEELTFTYNVLDEEEKGTNFYWDKRWNFECKCGSKKCQKNIDKYVKP